MKHLLICTTLLLFNLIAVVSSAQDYVVTAKGDTVKGKVKMFVNGLDKRVQVTQANKKKQTFTIIQVRSFRLQEDYFRPVKFADAYVFMKLLKQGYLSLFAFQMTGQLTYDGRYLLKMDGQGIEVPNLGFKRSMTRFLIECPDLSKQIEEGKRGYSDLNGIIDAFNECIDTKTITKASNSVKTDPAGKVNFEQWNELAVKVQNSSLSEKNDALDMIKDIKNKMEKGEQIPKFLTEALKGALKNDEALMTDLMKALEGL